MKKVMKKNKGFTLIEVLITLAIMTIVLQLIYSLFFVGNKSFNISKNKGFAQQNARIALDFINSELRTAREISETQLSGTYYSLSLKDGKLHRQVYNGSESPITISSNLECVEFSQEDIKEGLLNITITTLEAENTKDKQDFNLETSILLENIGDFSLVINVDINEDKILYYQKYE